MILAGDVGGTKVHLALFENVSGNLNLIKQGRFLTRDHSGLEPVLEQFLIDTPSLTHVCLGVAGPIENRRARLTNLSWTIDSDPLKEFLQVSEVTLINDLSALASSLPFLNENDLECIQQGEPHDRGRIGVLAVGTGLGQAFLVPQGNAWQVLDTEGGHCDFAPRTETEWSLLGYLAEKYGRVSIERVLSGAGILDLYGFFKSTEDAGINTESDQDQEKTPEKIFHEGLGKKDPISVKVLTLFLQILGAVAGNLALQLLTRGGLCIGGGIGTHLLPLLSSDSFLEVFLSKGRFRPFLEKVPVHVIKNDQAALIGAAHYSLNQGILNKA